MEGHGGRLRFAVLGPVRVWSGGTLLPPGSPRQQALLAALLLRGGRTATASELIDAVWGENPPEAAVASLRTHASRLRKALGPDGGRSLLSSSGGYALRVERGALDLDVAEEYAARAGKAESDGEPGTARNLLEAALALWEGETMAGVPGPHAGAQRARIEERRLQLLEARLEMDLRTGRHAQAVTELTALTSAHPLRERLRAQLMVALYRSNRQAEALGVYSDCRRLLAGHSGVGPSRQLRELNRRILQADPSLAAPSGTLGSGASPMLLHPAGTSLSSGGFTGRGAVVKELVRRLAGDDGQLTVIAGIAGVGKTALSVHVAHAARALFPDGQLQVDLRGAGAGALEPRDVLGTFLRALGTAPSAVPDSTDERAALYRSLLHGHRFLIVLDNARDAAQVRPLLPGTPDCAVLVNSRSRMADLAGGHLVELDVMEPEDALELFTNILGEERTARERDAALDAVAACGFLPLAIRIAASRLASHGDWTLSGFTARLADKRNLLNELRTHDLAVAAAFRLSYDRLTPQQARAFRLLGLQDHPEISLHAAAALLDLGPHDTEEVLESLVDTSLLESAAAGRYRFHDLIRLFARTRAYVDEEPRRRLGAHSRLLDFYLATTAGVYALERPAQPLVDHLEPTVHPGLVFPGRAHALEWLFSEERCMLACAAQLTGSGFLRRSVDLVRLLSDLAGDTSDSRHIERVSSTLLTAACAAGDEHAQARMEVTLSWTEIVAARFDEADRHARAAVALAASAGDRCTASTAMNDRGIVALQQNRPGDAETLLREALEAFRADGNRPAEASALCNLSRAHLAAGQVEEAVRLARQGVGIYRQTGATMRLANAMYALGTALTRSGGLAEAADRLTDALAVFRSSRHRFWTGMTHLRLAEVHLAARRHAEAADEAERAVALLRGCGELWSARTLTVLGRALHGTGETQRARMCWREALTVCERLGSHDSEELRSLLAGHGSDGPP
ncbi:regulator [Streptomyces abyssalis]|uniref:Regulator n=1 Tax=Streptomyces abyssalis TaxID=933944 RepID=A0A1E7JU60_9ACTN|nr:BTAD domain-containing putative transcriptional regulator [Streptomyces abyssalis]OEU88873.1 regulator [Streptomyces abyssalis]OEU93469.1 regulator [Streptomyces abyssalis]